MRKGEVNEEGGGWILFLCIEVLFVSEGTKSFLCTRTITSIHSDDIIREA
jgi:hypothetical protein